MFHSASNPSHRNRASSLRRRLIATMCVLAFGNLATPSAQAVVAYSPGTLTVDANSAVSGAFNTVTIAPEIAASTNADWPNTTPTTFTFTAPAHFVFDNTTAASAAILVPGDLVLNNAGVETPTATTLTFSVNMDSTIPSTIRFPDLKLRAVDCVGATVGDAADILLTVAGAGATTITNFPIVDVVVTAGDGGANMGLDHFDVIAVPLTQAAGSNILFTLTARDMCNNAIAGFTPASPITLFASGGAGVRTYTDGTLLVTPTVANTATTLSAFNGITGDGTFNATSPLGENADITISATLGTATGSTIVHWVTTNCVLSPSGVLRPVGTLHAVTATVTQNGGTPVANINVNFNVTAGPNVGVNDVATTNGLGQATFFYIGGALTGVDTIEATGFIGAASFTVTDPLAVEWISPVCNITPALPPTAAGGAQMVLVDVERRTGVDVPDGTMVTLTVIGGPNTLFTDTQPTAAGIATFNYTDTGGPGLDTLRANGSVAGAPFECLTTKEWIQPSCTLTPPASVNGINTIHEVNITLFRRPGVPAAGVNVDMDVVAGPHEPDALAAPDTITTNALGQFAVPYSYLGTLAGPDTIRASGAIDGVPFLCEADKEWIDSGCGLNLTSPVNPTSQIGTQQTVTVTVLRTTPPNTPAVNAIVNFAVTGVNPTVGAGVTDVNGEASFTYTGNNTGSDTITATTTVDGVLITCPVNKDWTNLSCSLDPPTDTNPIGTPHQVEVTLLQNGAPLDGESVTFAVIAGPNTGIAGVVSGNTGSTGSGQTTFTYTGGGNTGTDTIRSFVTVSGVLVECFATKTWVAQPSCAIAAMAPSLVGGMQTVNVDVDRAPGLDAADGTVVNFLVIAGPNVLTAGMDTTTGGAADFTYASNGTPGVDTIRASGTIAGVPFECLATKEWIQPSCELTPPTSVNAINTAHSVNITLLRRPGVPAAGVNVTMDVIAGPNAAVAPQVIMTNASGQFAAPFTYMGGATPGTDTIDASGTIDGVAFNCQASKEWINSGCGLNLTSPVNPTSLIGTQQTVTVTVLRTTPPNTPAVNAIVNFTVTGVNPTVGAGVTDINGQASFTYTGNNIGTDTITATTTVDGVPITCPVTKDWINLSCSLDPPTATNPVGSSHAVEVTLLQNGAPLDGVAITFAVIAGPNTGVAGIVTGNTGSTGSGQSTFTYTGGANTGTDTIRASAMISGVLIECQATKTWVAQPSCTITPMTASLVGGAQTVTVDVDQAPGQNAPNGTIVNFLVIAGPNVLTGGAVPTAGGTANFPYTSNGVPGVDSIRASGTIAGIPFECLTTKEWIQPSCTLTPPTSVNRINTAHSVNITLLRRPGVPAAGINVTMDVIAGPNAAAVGPQVIVTNASGQFAAPFSYMGGATPGTDTIDASGTIDGVAFNCQASKEWIDSGCLIDPFVDTNPVGTQHTVTVTVLRTTPPNTPAINAIVNFTVTGANPTVGAGVTNVNGQASFTYTGNNTGTDTITATTTVDGVLITCPATKTWVDASCSITPPDETNLVGTNHIATVTLVTNIPAQANNVPVSFLILSGPNAGTALATATGPLNGFPAGQAQFPYTSDGTPGTDTIRAAGLVAGVPFECQTTKIWVDPQCSLLPATETNPTGTSHTFTGTVTRNGAAATGINVVFTIISGPNNGLVHNAVTNASGSATFTYTGSGGVGLDTVELTGVLDGIPFVCMATKTWQAAGNNGVPPDVEDGAPNNGDGNNDGIPDSLQDNVASFLDINGNYVTLVSPPGTRLTNVVALGPPAGGIPPPDVTFPAGFFGFHVEGISPGATVVVTMILHSNPTMNTFYKFGPTPIIPVDHFYSFLFDGTTGAEISGNVVTLHFVDGQRGDHDLSANGVIVEPGAPALQSDNPAPITPFTSSCGLCGAVSAMTMVVTVLGMICIRFGRPTRNRRRVSGN